MCESKAPINAGAQCTTTAADGCLHQRPCCLRYLLLNEVQPVCPLAISPVALIYFLAAAVVARWACLEDLLPIGANAGFDGVLERVGLSTCTQQTGYNQHGLQKLQARCHRKRLEARVMSGLFAP